MLLLCSSLLHAQRGNGSALDKLRTTGLDAAFDSIRNRCGLKFSYADEHLLEYANKRFVFRVTCSDVDQLLRDLLGKTQLNFQRNGTYVSVYRVQSDAIRINVADLEGSGMVSEAVLYDKSRIIAISDAFGLLLIDKRQIFSSDTFVLAASGYVPEVLTKDDLDNANKSTLYLRDNTLLNEFEKLGYTAAQWLKKSVLPFGAEIKAGAMQTGVMGERDPMQGVRMLPGVQGGGEGVPGLVVRGMGPDQNLLMFDGITVYQPYHLFGLLSGLNQHSVSTISLHKNYLPARYSGRAGAAVEVAMKQGNAAKTKGSFSAGLLSTSLNLDGPIKSNRLRFAFGLRKSNTDLFVLPLLRSAGIATGLFGGFSYGFYDFNFNLHWQIKAGKDLELNSYRGADQGALRFDSEQSGFPEFRERNRRSFSWGSDLISLKFRSLSFDRKRSFVLQPYISRYSTLFLETDRLVQQQPDSAFITQVYNRSFRSGLTDFGLRAYVQTQHSTLNSSEFGYHGMLHRYNPGRVSLYNEFNDQVIRDTIQGYATSWPVEHNIYWEQQLMSLNKHWILKYGLNAAFFGRRDEWFARMQPRWNLTYRRDSMWSVQTGFARTDQFLHWFPGDYSGIPVAHWFPSGDGLLPLSSDHAYVGFDVVRNKFGFRIESFIRSMSGVYDLIPGSGPMDIENSGESRRRGNGLAFGSEAYLWFQSGNFHAYGAYTWTRSLRRIQGINDGQVYPHVYDKPHDVKIHLSYQKGKWLFNLNGYMHSGALYTLPTSRYQTEILGVRVFQEHYSRLNNHRLPIYHRIDLSAMWHRNARRGKEIWQFGLFNAYNRLNPMFVQLQTNADQGIRIRYSGVFPILPMFQYEFRF